MAKEIVKDTISISQATSVRGVVYRCMKRTQLDCTTECDMFNKEKGTCLGTCYRYDRDDIVFVKCGYEYDMPKNAIIFRTPYRERYDEALSLIRSKQKIMK